MSDIPFLNFVLSCRLNDGIFEFLDRVKQRKIFNQKKKGNLRDKLIIEKNP